MKKLLTIIVLLVALVPKGYAEDVTLWSGTQVLPDDWGETHLTGDGFSSLTSGTVLRVSLTNTNTSYTSLQIWVKDSNGENDTQVPAYSATKTVYEFYVTESLLSKVQNGLYIKGENTITLTKIEKVTDDLISFTPGEGETVIDYTQAVMQDGWAKSLMIGTSNFQSANAGDILTVYLSSVSSGTISLSSNNAGLSDASNSGKALEDAATTYTLTLTESDVTALKAKELRITGQGFTVTGVTLNPNVLWSGTQILPDDWGESHLTGDGFSSLTSGTVLRVSLTNTNTSYTSLQIWVKDSNGENDTQVPAYSATKTVYEFYVTESLLSKVQNGLYIKGENTITLTKIEKVTDALISFTPGEGETVIDYTQAVMQDGWAKSLMVGTSNFQSANEGDILTVYLSSVSSGTISLSSNDAGLSDASNSGKALEDAATTYTLPLTESDVTALKAKELRITGQGFTVIGVTLKAGEVVDPNLLWSGTQALTDGAFALEAAKFAAVSSGDRIRLTIGSTSEGDKTMVVTYTSGTTPYETFNGTVTANTYDFEITATNIAAIKESGISITGSNATLTKVERITDAYTPGEISLSALPLGWGSTYDSDSKTVSFTDAWQGRGWNVGDDKYNTKNNITLGFTEDPTNLQVEMNYVDAYGKTVTSIGIQNGNYLHLAVPSGIVRILNVVLKNKVANVDAEFSVVSLQTTQTLKTATQKMVNETVGTKVLIANSAFANVSAGDILTVNMSEVATGGAFIVLKENSSGTSLFGSNYSSALTSGQTSFTHTLTADDMTLLTGDSKALCITGEGFTCGNITITSAGSITADAAHTTMYVLSVTQPAAGGTIQIGGTDAVAQKAYDNGTQVTLTAVRDGGYALSQWTKDEANAGSESTLTVTFDGADIAVTATFVEDGSDPNVIWDGNQTIDWNNSQFVQIAASKFTGMNLGDKLIFTIANSANNGQLQLTNSGWAVMAGTANTPISEGMTQVVYYINNSMLAELANGLIISGVGFDLKEVKKAEGDGGDYSNAVWIGEKEMGSWGDQAIDKSVFANAAENQLLRVNFKGLSNIYAQMVLRNKTTGADLTSYDPISGIYKQYTITSELLSVLKNNGLTIAGSGFTLTSVEVIDPSTIKNLTLSVPVTNDRIWSGNPTITISVTNNEATSVTAKAEIRVSKDNFESVTTVIKNEEVASGETKNIDFSFDAVAGFYRIIPVVNGEMACNEFVVGVNPTQIVSAPDKQSDFDSYWTAAKDQLAAVEATDEPVLTELTDRSSATRKVYLVEMKSIADGTSGEPVTIRGYYAEPQDGKKHPVLIHYQGYDSGMGPGGVKPAVYIPSADGSTSDYAEFVLSTRGQVANNRTAAERGDGLPGDFVNTYGDWFAYQFGHKDSYYYRGAYMDCVRAVDFMASRSTSDMDNLFAEGQSQGGAFTVAAAALSGRTFKAIAPAITFMGDFPDYFQIASWPASVAIHCKDSINNLPGQSMTDAEMYAFLSYYDTKNLATMISCPYITSIGVQDNVCPPHTNIAPYNNVTTAAANKRVIYNAELQHATNSEWNATMMAFFDNYKTALPDNRTEKTINETSTTISSDPEQGLTIAKTKFTNASSGDIIKVYVSNVASGATITMKEAGGDWSQLTSGSVSGDNYSYKLSAADVAKVKANGLHIMGNGFTSTKVTLKTEGEIPADEGGEEGGDDDDEPIIDEETGEADLSQLTAQNDTKTTLTQNEDGSITMTTTEAYCAAQIWFNDPEPVAGNVLKVELAESKVNVTVTVKYTDGTESQMSANTKAVVSARATTRAVASGTTIEVPLETGKEVQNIEVKNNEAGTITIKKMQVTTINVFTGGVANLAMLKPQSNATYDTSAHTLATTKGWTGATVSPVAGENVSGKELLIEFADASKVKVSVKYRTDVEGPSKIMDKAAKSVRLALDNTKNIQEISIQPTEAAIITFTKIAVNSEESDDGSLKPGKTITLWESATGETLSWNEVAKQDASVGEMLKEYDELLITVSGVVKDCDWPKLFIRDASSEQAGNEVLLNDVGSFPYTVRIVLTGEMAQQLQKGFSICGDGVTVKKLQVYRPEAPKTGDIHLADLNYGYNSSYDKGSHTITTTARWAARGWEIGDKRYNDKNLITVKFEAVDFPVTLKMEYTTGLQTAQATSVGVPAGRTELLLEIPKGISKLNRVYIIYENPGKVKLTEASVTYMENLKLSTAIQAFEADGVIRDGRYDTDGWYNLRGMRIPEPTTSGIYIHGGKKVVIY